MLGAYGAEAEVKGQPAALSLQQAVLGLPWGPRVILPELSPRPTLPTDFLVPLQVLILSLFPQ